MRESFSAAVRAVFWPLFWVAALVVTVGALAFDWRWAVWPMYVVAGVVCLLLVREAFLSSRDDRNEQQQRDASAVKRVPPPEPPLR